MPDATLTPAQLLNMTPEQFAERFQGADLSQVREQVAALAESDDMGALTLRGQAAQLILQAAEKLDQADALEHHGRLKAALAACVQPRQQAHAAVEQLKQAVKNSITAERAAEDRARDAAEHHRLAVDAERQAHTTHAAPDVQTDRLLRMRAAADVAAREQAAAEGAHTVRIQAEKGLTEARAHARRMEEVEAAAAKALGNPGVAPVSGVTALTDGLRRLYQGGRLDADAEAVARGELAKLAERTGVARQLRAEGAAQLREELSERQRNAFVPKVGHPLRPADAGQIYVPVNPTGR